MKEKLIQWIVINQYPFTIVQERAFRDFIQTIATNIHIPSASTIKTNIMKYYLANQEKVQKILQETES